MCSMVACRKCSKMRTWQLSHHGTDSSMRGLLGRGSRKKEVRKWTSSDKLSRAGLEGHMHAHGSGLHGFRETHSKLSSHWTLREEQGAASLKQVNIKWELPEHTPHPDQSWLGRHGEGVWCWETWNTWGPLLDHSPCVKVSIRGWI